MIRADAIALQSKIRQRQLEIREKELNFFIDNLNALSTSSALMAGFSFSALTGMEVPEESWTSAVIIYFILQTTSMIFELIALMNATVCVMFGPGLALRGPEDGMDQAVHGLEIEKKITFWYFRYGIVCFILAVGIWVWILEPWLIAVTVCSTLVFFLFAFWKYNIRIQNRFRIPEGCETIFEQHAYSLSLAPGELPKSLQKTPNERKREEKLNASPSSVPKKKGGPVPKKRGGKAKKRRIKFFLDFSVRNEMTETNFSHSLLTG